VGNANMKVNTVSKQLEPVKLDVAYNANENVKPVSN